MTDQTTPAQAGAQPSADVNSIDSIIDNATEATQEPVEQAPAEPTEPVEPADQPWPKKAENALAKEKGKTARLKFERDQERVARQQLEQQLAQYKSPQQKPVNTGEPKEDDFKSYADFIDAKNAYRIEQKFAEREGKEKVTQQSQQEQRWVEQREQAVAVKAQEFAKENPEVIALVEEYGDLIDELPPQIQRVFLEADNAPLAFYNLAKEGKLEELANMSPARAAMEIGRAQTQAPTKPKTKAPAPLPASRGSVASGKSIDDMQPDEIRKWMRTS